MASSCEGDDMYRIALVNISNDLLVTISERTAPGYFTAKRSACSMELITSLIHTSGFL